MGVYDLVLFGVTGYTGIKVLEALIELPEQKKFAVAGRDEKKIREVLNKVGERKGKDLSSIPIIIANCSDELSLISMVKQAKVVVNVVGPYRLYGEAVVRACVENGTSYVDVSGESAFLESMQLKYAEQAKENKAYIVGSCGWDSIPCDLGVSFLKKSCNGWLNHVESFVQMEIGDAGYTVNTGTYQSLVLSIANWKKDGLGKIRRQLMPEKLPRTGFSPPKRRILWYNDDLKTYCLPFLGTDKSVVSRSQYFSKQIYDEYPVLLQPYLCIKSLLWAVLVLAWITVFALLTQLKFTRDFLQAYPEICSFNWFRSSGPTEEQIKQAKFKYWFYGYGWDEKRTDVDQKPTSPPKKLMVLRCDGPDPSYIATASCAVCSALTILEEPENLPETGGVFTPAVAFKNTAILDRLSSQNIKFHII